MNIQQKLGKRIKKIRVKRNISQEKLAELANLDRTYISGIERGKRNVSIVNIEKIAQSLKVKISKLLD